MRKELERPENKAILTKQLAVDEAVMDLYIALDALDYDIDLTPTEHRLWVLLQDHPAAKGV